MPLEPGDGAPDFSLLDQRGRSFSLRASLEARSAPHLVYFYPRASTPGCTTQACGLRDVADQVGDTTIVGISPDQPATLAAFDDEHGLGFTLLSDPDHAVAEAFGAWGDRSMYGKTYKGVIRSAFLVDQKGTVAEAWPKITPKDTPKKLLRALAS